MTDQKEQQRRQDRADFYALVLELSKIAESLGRKKGKRLMDLVTVMKNNPRFALFTITDAPRVPNDISELTQEEEE